MLGDGRKRRLRILGPALYALLAAHSMAQPTAVGADTSTARPLSVSAYVWVPYQLRTGAGASDHDLYAIGALHAGDRAHHHLTAHAFARLSYDLDDDQRSATADPFRSVDDAGARPVDGRLYEAYVDGHRLPGLSVLRVGRQTLNQTPRRLHTCLASPSVAPKGILKYDNYCDVLKCRTTYIMSSWTSVPGA